jgi:hypothetical protein
MIASFLLPGLAGRRECNACAEELLLRFARAAGAKRKHASAKRKHAFRSYSTNLTFGTTSDKVGCLAKKTTWVENSLDTPFASPLPYLSLSTTRQANWL